MSAFFDNLKHTIVFRSYWKFAAERQSIYLKRLKDEQPPWTANKILQQWKFTCPFRVCDRISQYLIREVIYKSGYPTEPQEIVFRILLFKLFNTISAWEVLMKAFGVPTWEKFNFDAYAKVLGDAWDKGKGIKIWSRAYVQNQNIFTKYKWKYERYLALLRHMMNDRVTSRLQCARTYEQAFRVLQKFPLHKKGFISMQHSTDLNYSPVIDFDENDWIVPGPGCEDGMRKCFGLSGVSDPEAQAIIRQLVVDQEEYFKVMKCEPVTLFGRKLHAIDIQNIFCEVDKFARVAHPQFNLKNERGEIVDLPKQQFKLTGPLPTPFFPPKWGIKAIL